jgi:hypothetical protein
MIDNFERARDAVKATTEGEQKIDASYQSIYKQFVDVLKKLGIVPVPGAGSAFDPAVSFGDHTSLGGVGAKVAWRTLVFFGLFSSILIWFVLSLLLEKLDGVPVLVHRSIQR